MTTDTRSARRATKLLRDAGEALYGPRWQSELARDLNMSDRHMRRMAAGDAELTPGMAADLWRIAGERAASLEQLIERLKIAATPDR
jgi:methylphosphotriester-DNA--protein-cysteine methyltransferase